MVSSFLTPPVLPLSFTSSKATVLLPDVSVATSPVIFVLPRSSRPSPVTNFPFISENAALLIPAKPFTFRVPPALTSAWATAAFRVKLSPENVPVTTLWTSRVPRLLTVTSVVFSDVPAVVPVTVNLPSAPAPPTVSVPPLWFRLSTVRLPLFTATAPAFWVNVVRVRSALAALLPTVSPEALTPLAAAEESTVRLSTPFSAPPARVRPWKASWPSAPPL